MRTLDEKRAAEEEEISQLEAQIQALDLERDVPTESDLHAARVRAATPTGNASARPGSAAGAAIVAEPAALAEAFERSQAEADMLADRLRREADRVSRKSEWLSQLDRHRGARAAQAGTATRPPTRLTACAASGRRRPNRSGSGVDARRASRLAPTSRTGRAARRQGPRGHEVLEPLERERDGHCRTLERALWGLGESWPDDDGPSRGPPGAGRGPPRARGEDGPEPRQEPGLRPRRPAPSLAREQLGLKAVEAELSVWRGRWAEMMTRIGLEPDATSEQAEVFLEKIQELFQNLRKYRGFQSRIRGMDRDADTVCHRCRWPRPPGGARILTIACREPGP